MAVVERFNCRYRQSDIVFQEFTHTKPVSSIFLTPSQKIKKRSLDVQPPDGNWAMGNLMPPSPIKMNWRTRDASYGPFLCPEIKIKNYKNLYLHLWSSWLKKINESFVHVTKIPDKVCISPWMAPRSTKPKRCFPFLFTISISSCVKKKPSQWNLFKLT